MIVSGSPSIGSIDGGAQRVDDQERGLGGRERAGVKCGLGEHRTENRSDYQRVERPVDKHPLKAMLVHHLSQLLDETRVHRPHHCRGGGDAGRPPSRRPALPDQHQDGRVPGLHRDRVVQSKLTQREGENQLDDQQRLDHGGTPGLWT